MWIKVSFLPFNIPDLCNCLARKHIGTDTETLKGHILTFFGRSECSYTVSACMWCMFSQMFSAVPGQEEKCTLSSSFLPLSPRSLPCLQVLSAWCYSHCLDTSVGLRLAWLTEKKWALFNYFILSCLFFHPLSVWPSVCPKGTIMCLCVCSLVHACMHGCVLNVTVIVECGGFYCQGSHWVYEGMCHPKTDEEIAKKSKRIMKQM